MLRSFTRLLMGHVRNSNAARRGEPSTGVVPAPITFFFQGDGGS
jgi:hypothetical protein